MKLCHLLNNSVYQIDCSDLSSNGFVSWKKKSTLIRKIRTAKENFSKAWEESSVSTWKWSHTCLSSIIKLCEILKRALGLRTENGNYVPSISLKKSAMMVRAIRFPKHKAGLSFPSPKGPREYSEYLCMLPKLWLKVSWGSPSNSSNPTAGLLWLTLMRVSPKTHSGPGPPSWRLVTKGTA